MTTAPATPPSNVRPLATDSLTTPVLPADSAPTAESHLAAPEPITSALSLTGAEITTLREAKQDLRIGAIARLQAAQVEIVRLEHEIRLLQDLEAKTSVADLYQLTITV